MEGAERLLQSEAGFLNEAAAWVQRGQEGEGIARFLVNFPEMMKTWYFPWYFRAA